MTLLPGLLVLLALIGTSVPIVLSEISFAARKVRLRAWADAGDSRATRFLGLRRDGGQVITVPQVCLNVVCVLGGIASEGLADPFQEQAILRRDENSWLVDGVADLGDVVRALGIERPGEPAPGWYQTIGGFVMHRLRRIPREAGRLEAAGFTFEVVDVEGFRINRLLVTRQRAG